MNVRLVGIIFENQRIDYIGCVIRNGMDQVDRGNAREKGIITKFSVCRIDGNSRTYPTPPHAQDWSVSSLSSHFALSARWM